MHRVCSYLVGQEFTLGTLECKMMHSKWNINIIVLNMTSPRHNWCVVVTLKHTVHKKQVKFPLLINIKWMLQLSDNSFLSICFPGTESAVRKLSEFGAHFILDNLPEVQPTDAAYAIVRGGALRLNEIYFPYTEARLTTIFRHWFPGIIQGIIQFLYSWPIDTSTCT